MGNMNFDHRKLLEIQMLALQCHHNLIYYHNAEDIEEKGGCLIQGSHYAASRKMLIGINPVDEGGEFIVNLLQNPLSQEWVEGPWDTKPGDPAYQKEPYWRNCSNFFNSDKDLRDWVRDATSTFVCPWGTKGKKELENHHLWENKGIMWQYSRDVVQKMIEHCNPKVIIAVSEFVRNTLEDFFGCKATLVNQGILTKSKPKHNVSIYQWRDSTIYEVNPHFAYRYIDSEALKKCAEWLMVNLVL
jgi:hypothetical protein